MQNKYIKFKDYIIWKDRYLELYLGFILIPETDTRFSKVKVKYTKYYDDIEEVKKAISDKKDIKEVYFGEGLDKYVMTHIESYMKYRNENESTFYKYMRMFGHEHWHYKLFRAEEE